ncbi:MAG: hypothetical protein AB1625_09395 [Acidobacteriota bacterium]
MRAVLLALVATWTVTSAATGQPTIRFEDSRVIIAGVTSGGRVACYGVAHDFLGFDRAVYRWGREASDDDRDGAVAIALPRTVPVRSIWACTDVVTGLFALAGPGYSPAKEVGLPGRGLFSPPQGGYQFQVETDRVDLFLIRPGGGAWLNLTGDGAANDADRTTNGRVSATAEHFTGIGAARGVPATLERGARIVAFFPLSLEYAVVTLGE